jgi:hypothetical protein
VKILIAPNEDGLGSSSWSVRVAWAFLRQGHSVRLAAIKDSTVSFLRLSLHGTSAEVVQLPGVTDWIELAKSHGRVLREATAHCVEAYGRYRESYQRALSTSGVLAGVSQVLELGVPPLAAALNGRIPSATLLDHAWSLTLRRITGDHPALDDMAADERSTSRVFLPPHPVTPPVFAEYWRSAGMAPIPLPGMIGGGGPRVRKEARLALGLDPGMRLVFVSGAGTAVWKGMLRGLVDSLLESRASYHTLVFSPSETDRLGLRLRWRRSPAGWEVETARRGGVTFFGRTRGETHHAIVAAADLVVSRAGGGTVNDAIAQRVPLILVEEPGHWQVEEIRRACAAAGVARTVSLDRFLRQPRAVLEGSHGRLRSLNQERHRTFRYQQFIETSIAKLLQI